VRQPQNACRDVDPTTACCSRLAHHSKGAEARSRVLTPALPRAG
jgi:hypothetical protein